MTEDENGGGREERERYRELLEEHRTTLPGVQVLFAFLLTATFSARFEELDRVGRGLYAAALVGTALATFLLLAPASYHRVAPRRQRRERLRTSIRLNVIGMFVLALSILDAVFVVVRFVFDTGMATAVVAALGSLVVIIWYLLPLRARMSSEGRSTRS